MKTAYRLMDTPIDELEDLYIGVVEFQTFELAEMVDYITEMEEPDIDKLYSVNVYPSTDAFSKLEDGKYYKPTAFVEEFGKN